MGVLRGRRHGNVNVSWIGGYSLDGSLHFAHFTCKEKNESINIPSPSPLRLLSASSPPPLRLLSASSPPPLRLLSASSPTPLRLLSVSSLHPLSSPSVFTCKNFDAHSTWLSNHRDGCRRDVLIPRLALQSSLTSFHLPPSFFPSFYLSFSLSLSPSLSLSFSSFYHFIFCRQIDPQLKSPHEPIVLFWHFYQTNQKKIK